MSYRTVISIAAAVILGIACVSTDALAYRGGYRGGGVHRGGAYHGGVHRRGAYHGGVYRGGYVRRGVGVGVYPRCGYYPYPACY